MDELRARAFLDLLLGQDSRPRPGGAAPPADPAAAGPAGGPVPAGFAGRVTLTVPLATLTGLADRPGELAGLGPVDPWLARDLAAAAARNPKTTWCLTVTDGQGPRRRPRLRPARTQESHGKRAGPGPPGRNRVHLHPGQPGRAARRVRHLAAAHPRARTGPDHHPGPADHRPLRPPARSQRPRSRGQAAAPVPGPARHLHQPRLPAARRPVRPRAQHPLRSRRTDLSLQHRPQMPPRPPAQAAPQMEGRPAPRRHLQMDHPFGADLHHRADPLPHLMRWLRRGGQRTAAIAGNSRVTRCWSTGQIPFATWMKSIILAGIVLICGRFGPGR